MRTSIAVAAAALLTACSQSAPPQPTSTATPTQTTRAEGSGPCADGFVEIAADKPACGIALNKDGSLTFDAGRTPPIIVRYQESADGQVALPAREVVLFPPSPQRSLRVIQACESPDANSLCWATRLLDPKSATLHQITAGKYGPSHWISLEPARAPRRTDQPERGRGVAEHHRHGDRRRDDLSARERERELADRPRVLCLDRRRRIQLEGEDLRNLRDRDAQLHFALIGP